MRSSADRLGTVLLTAAVTTALAAPGGAAAASAPARPPSVDVQGERQAGLVDAEDARIRQVVRGLPPGTPPFRSVSGATTTWVLTAAARPYTLASLVRIGALERTGAGVYLMRSSVLVGPGARLEVTEPGSTLRLASGPGGFTSLVTFQGTLHVVGAPGRPVRLTSWDVPAGQADETPSDGRAYVRSIGGAMRLKDVELSRLGFWSARTGGLAWTSAFGNPAAGAAARVTVRDGYYGAYLSGAERVTLQDSTFAGNRAGGVLVHNGSSGVVVDRATVAGNGGDGIRVDRGSSDVTVSGSTVHDNAGSGVLLDGRALADGPSIDGSSLDDYAGLVVRGGTVARNAGSAVLVVGGRAPLVERVRTEGSRDGIWARGAVHGLTVRDNHVVAAEEVGVKLSAGVASAVVTGNTVQDARTGLRIADSVATVQDNRVTGATRHALALRGRLDGTTVRGNTFSGRGPAAISTDASVRAVVTGNTEQQWSRRFDPVEELRAYLASHPVALLWLLLLGLPVVTGLQRARFRARASRVAHPYATTQRTVIRLPDTRPTGRARATSAGRTGTVAR